MGTEKTWGAPTKEALEKELREMGAEQINSTAEFWYYYGQCFQIIPDGDGWKVEEL